MPRRTVVIGAARPQKLPALVLEHTILKNTTHPVTIIHTYDMTFQEPKKDENRSRTGFSFVRFAVPELSGFQGLAAYLESDQIVYRDIDELFSLPFVHATVLATRVQTSVLVIDCDAVRWNLGKVIRGLDLNCYSYSDLMERLAIEPKENISRSIPDAWNRLDVFEPGKTALLHFTNMATQPWRSPGHPYRDLWIRELVDAINTRRISTRIVSEEIARGYVSDAALRGLQLK